MGPARVVDMEKSERGPQRRRSAETGRPLHCCCICGALSVWNANWTHYGSLKEEDDGDPARKFCNDLCAKAAGPECQNVTHAMREAARAAEYREPELVWREMTEREKYFEAARHQAAMRKRRAP